MSAATALFVLERTSWRKAESRTLVTALGPGFSSAFLVLDPS
jgi:alkylresorcinol/alkylpyrone synthase